jgi:hypothetical protein
MKIEVSNGELVDKVSILAIKSKKIKSQEKLKNIKKEYELLKGYMHRIGITEESEIFKQLLKVNSELWEIEDKIRIKESKKEFDDDFIELARAVYFTNDKRFELKNKINESTDSGIKEMKEYVDYQ